MSYKAKIKLSRRDSSLEVDGTVIPFFDLSIHQDFSKGQVPVLTVSTYIKDMADIEFDGEIKIKGIPLKEDVAKEMYRELKKKFEI